MLDTISGKGKAAKARKRKLLDMENAVEMVSDSANTAKKVNRAFKIGLTYCKPLGKAFKFLATLSHFLMWSKT